MYMYVCTVYITSKKTRIKTTVEGCRDGSEQKSYKLNSDCRQRQVMSCSNNNMCKPILLHLTLCYYTFFLCDSHFTLCMKWCGLVTYVVS